MLTRKELRKIKKDPKRLSAAGFAPVKRNSLPPPLRHVGSARHQCTGLLNVADDLHVIFLWKTGDILEKRALYGWLFRETRRGLFPLLRLDWHPSHKRLHAVLNCEVERDLLGRDVVGGKELNLDQRLQFDPDEEQDRARFIECFCEACGVALGREDLIA